VADNFFKTQEIYNRLTTNSSRSHSLLHTWRISLNFIYVVALLYILFFSCVRKIVPIKSSIVEDEKDTDNDANEPLHNERG
jgi:hypothetical protein